MLKEPDKQKLREFINNTPYQVVEEYGPWFVSRVEIGNGENSLNREVIREIYDEVGIIPESHNIYNAFLAEIKRIHGIDGRHIIEVGGGAFPRLAERIRLEQRSGSIKVFDPRLFEGLPESKGLKLVREPFRRNTPTYNANLLIGLMPCGGAEPLIENATSKGIDFITWLCEGGYHGEPVDYFESDDEWRSTMIYMAKRGVEEKKMGKLMIKTLPEFSPYPIIYNQR